LLYAFSIILLHLIDHAVAGRRVPPLHEPLRIRATMPHAAVPPGCFLFDLGLEAIYKVPFSPDSHDI
jgi:hypothetical protein